MPLTFLRQNCVSKRPERPWKALNQPMAGVSLQGSGGSLVAKLYFRYGSVGSAKTLNLLAVAHNYRQQGKSVLLLKPQLDTRFGVDTVKSRAGLSQEADILINAETRISAEKLKGVNALLVDEAQFLTPEFIDHLRYITLEFDVPVICYGLRTDFRTRLFTGSQRLLEIADSIEEVKNTCRYCDRKALFNMRVIDGVPTLEGPTILLGCEEAYLPTCARCFDQMTSKSKTQSPAKEGNAQ